MHPVCRGEIPPPENPLLRLHNRAHKSPQHLFSHEKVRKALSFFPRGGSADQRLKRKGRRESKWVHRRKRGAACCYFPFFGALSLAPSAKKKPVEVPEGLSGKIMLCRSAIAQSCYLFKGNHNVALLLHRKRLIRCLILTEGHYYTFQLLG